MATYEHRYGPDPEKAEPEAGNRTHDEGTALIGPVAAPSLHVMSWNIRRRTGRFHPRVADRWHRRAPGVRALLQAERPTLLGAQEVLEEQSRFLVESLGADYGVVGQGRGPRGGGEASPIFYDAGRLELLDCEQTALSDAPYRPGSTSWGNLIPRVLVSARFRDLQTSTVFLALNTHLDHLSARSRLRSAQVIRERVLHSGLPAVLTADFNADGASAPLAELLQDAALAETWAAAEHHDSHEWGTFANYRPPRRDRPRIDWILATPGIRVLRTAINAQRHGGAWASDHLPVHAVVTLPKEGDTP
ncbi:endonuclease/exonuclease/phosphatase family protein [Nesterenkonia sp. Act20]|uniref:endonuclease/exonuclease/phosphatase family protein n=1 Tax=Nesterenkonia sp. Act20 TaxID=1483432 RepID=UPI001C43D14E|nr:endonuclease/exonuclease/phosphatase family protein [Nesterenkonia sp. Act20]